tara:strand:+ start:322 stop:597 length:276 start_codon:yes stop_codon:yes gene_type:complete
MAEKKDKKKKKVAVETIAGLGASAVAGGLGIKKLANVMSKNVKTGSGGSFTQFGTGKRGAEKLRKSPFELSNGGDIDMSRGQAGYNFKGIF